MIAMFAFRKCIVCMFRYDEPNNILLSPFYMLYMRQIIAHEID